MKKLFIVLFALALASGLGAQETYFSINASLLIGADTRDSLVTAAQDMGGYVTLDSNQRMLFRVPADRVQVLRTLLDQNAQRVLNYEMVSRSIAQELRSVEAAIASRTEILERNMGYLDEANVSGTLALEREITSIISELERYKGRRNMLLNQAAYAQVRLQLSAPQPQTPGDQSSNFAWLSELHFYQFMEGGLE